ENRAAPERPFALPSAGVRKLPKITGPNKTKIPGPLKQDLLPHLAAVFRTTAGKLDNFLGRGFDGIYDRLRSFVRMKCRKLHRASIFEKK
ncbi:MAG: hypothetical protein ACM3XS_07510, partial [Bacteroidota bacterium]